MDDEIEIEFGVRIIPRKRPLVKENSIVGAYWGVEIKDGKCFCHYDTGSYSGALVTFEVPMHIFDSIKTGEVTIEEVVDKYYR